MELRSFASCSVQHYIMYLLSAYLHSSPLSGHGRPIVVKLATRRAVCIPLSLSLTFATESLQDGRRDAAVAGAVVALA